MTIEFRPLASSSAGCAYVLSGGGANAPLLLDAGVRFDMIQQALDFKVSRAAGCLLSHGHGDHCKSVPNLLASAVDVFASEETWQSQFLKTHEWSHSAQRVKAREQVKVGDWDVLPFDAVHDQPGTYGFLAGAPSGEKLLYLTATAYSLFNFQAVTIWAVECNWSEQIFNANAAAGAIHPGRRNRTVRTHMSLERLVAMLKANDLSKTEAIYLLHLSDQNADEDLFKRTVQRATGVPTSVAAKSATPLTGGCPF
jgi:phosphoribosyl 1,2-cyclic phosphodiesterase